MREQRKNRRERGARKSQVGTTGQGAPSLFVSGFGVPACLVLIVVSALSVLQSTHRSRQLFSELQELKKQARHLEEHWGRLLLEQSTWASPDRVQRVSEGRLKMLAPEMNSMVTVRIYGQDS